MRTYAASSSSRREATDCQGCLFSAKPESTCWALPPDPHALTCPILHVVCLPARLHHLSEYLAKATSLVRMQGAAPVVILTTDDEAVIEQVEGGQARLYQLDFYYTRWGGREGHVP